MKRKNPEPMPEPRIQKVVWSPLSAWICVPFDATDAECAEAARCMAACPMTVPDALVVDRLYGGFKCGNSDDRRHVFVASGEYTYFGVNEPNGAEQRAETWRELIARDNHYVGGGPFTADAPTLEEVNQP
jgi:hypothetical protein